MKYTSTKMSTYKCSLPGEMTIYDEACQIIVTHLEVFS